MIVKNAVTYNVTIHYDVYLKIKKNTFLIFVLIYVNIYSFCFFNFLAITIYFDNELIIFTTIER